MRRSVRKAVIPVAGRGTRLDPLTRYLPKELLPVGDKPILQHVMEMYLASGIVEFFVITSRNKPQIRDFLTGTYQAASLPYRRDNAFYERIAPCRMIFVNQEKPWGVAHAISLARDFVSDEPFSCIMPDCLLFSDKPFLGQLTTAFSIHGQNTIGTIRIGYSDAKRYGNVGMITAEPVDHVSFRVRSLSPKTRSTLHVSVGNTAQKGFGGGIYLPDYFELVERIQPDTTGEIDDVAIHQLLIDQECLLGVSLEGTPFDTGHPLGYRSAVMFAGRPLAVR